MLTRRSVITVGNFDGVHMGHRRLIAAARELAASLGGADVVAMSFTKHPMSAIKPQAVPPMLMDIPQRMAALLEAGVDRIEWMQPESGVLHLTPRQFVEQTVRQLRPVGWVEGPDFRFGFNRGGDVEALHGFGSELGFAVRVVDPVIVVLRDKTVCGVSSSVVRWLLGEGRVADAALCLGKPFALRGKVIKGEQRGRTIGFPTVNIEATGRQLPADGVYAGAVEVHGREYLAAISVGTKPTFGRVDRTFEAYILDFTGDLYDHTLEIHVTRWLRDQAIFPSTDSLTDQMNRDVAGIRRLHAEGLLNPVTTVRAA